jgi:hypothetical protein
VYTFQYKIEEKPCFLHVSFSSDWALAKFGKFCRLRLIAIRRYAGSMKTPNQLSREAIEEFKAIYQEEFGELLSNDEVQEIAMRLLRFFGIMNKDK